jgi:hypothetical protein
MIGKDGKIGPVGWASSAGFSGQEILAVFHLGA